MPRAEINWTRETEEGEKLQVRAHRIGDRWQFFARGKRFDEWAEVEAPPLEDWIALLDGVRRRINRRLARPEDEALVIRMMKAAHPHAEIPRRT